MAGPLLEKATWHSHHANLHTLQVEVEGQLCKMFAFLHHTTALANGRRKMAGLEGAGRRRPLCMLQAFHRP